MAGGEEEEEEKGERWRKMEMSEREMEWLAATIVIYGIPPRQTLDMTPKSWSFVASLLSSTLIDIHTRAHTRAHTQTHTHTHTHTHSHFSTADLQDAVITSSTLCYRPSPPTHEISTPTTVQSPIPIISYNTHM